jgi:multicomponent Na+:H+ antiporter subunit A
VLFALLISGIGALVVIYAGSYLHGHTHLGRFYSYILMFMASMLGLVLADNLIALFVFWELTSISSYLLIGFNHQQESARAASLQALLVTGGGGLALLAGFLLLGHAGGGMEISTLLESGTAVRSHPLYTPILLLVLAGAFTKSAQVPFHFWLPNAMEAPTPVSAYLHSATMVKAGVYLLARLTPVLGGTELWLYTLTAAGATTMLVGAFLALRQTDFKRILAYLTVSALGILVLFLGLGSSQAIIAAMVFLLAHALYKGALWRSSADCGPRCRLPPPQPYWPLCQWLR